MIEGEGRDRKGGACNDTQSGQQAGPVGGVAQESTGMGEIVCAYEPWVTGTYGGGFTMGLLMEKICCFVESCWAPFV